MENDNFNQVDLANLGTASAADLNEAMEAQPETVKTEEEVKEGEEKKPEALVTTFSDGLDHMSYIDEDGYATMHNRRGSFIGGDLDQFGHRTMVTGLDKGFQFTGWEDTYKRSEEAQGVWEKTLNGVLQFAGDSVLETTKGLAMIPGAFNGLAQWDFTAVFDNAMQRGIDSVQKDYDKYFEIKRGGDQGAVKNTANFVFDDIFGAFSFVIGAVATESILTALTVGTAGGGGSTVALQAAATTGLAARGARVVKALASGGKRIIKGQFIDDAIKGFQAATKDATRRAMGKEVIAAGTQGAKIASINGAGRLGRQLLTGAGMEAGVESRQMMEVAGDTHKRQYEKLNGRGTYTEEMADDFRLSISSESDKVFLANMALVGISNMLMFPRLFGVSLRQGMKAVKTVPKSSLTAAGRRQAAKAYGVAEDALPKLLDASRGTRMGRNLRRTAGVRIGLYEGFVEEGGQGTISRGAEHYIAEKYNPVNTEQTANITNAFLHGIEGSYATAAGLKEVGIGFLIGMLGVPNVLRTKSAKADGVEYTPFMMGGVQGRRDAQTAKDKSIDNILNLYKKHGDVNSILEAEAHNMNIQKGLIRQADIAYENNDFKQAKDIEADQIFAHATSKITTGRFDDAIQESKEILDDMSVEDYRELLGPDAVNMSDAEVQSRKQEVHDSYVKKMNAVKEAYDVAGEIYRGENPDIHAGVANMVYNLKDRDTREEYVANSIAEKLKTFNGDQVLEASRMVSELNITEGEIDKLSALGDKILRIEKQLNTKVERKIIKNINPEKAEKRAAEIEKLNIELTQAYEDQASLQKSFLSRKNIEGTYEFDTSVQIDRFNALIDMNKALKAAGESVTDINLRNIREDVSDLQEITKDRERMIAAYNDLIEPGGYDRFLSRMQGTIADMHKQTAEEKAIQDDAEFNERQEEIEKEAEEAKKAAEEELEPGEDPDIQGPVDMEVDDAGLNDSPYSNLSPEQLTPEQEDEYLRELNNEPGPSNVFITEEKKEELENLPSIPAKLVNLLKTVQEENIKGNHINALNAVSEIYEYLETQVVDDLVDEQVRDTLRGEVALLSEKGWGHKRHTYDELKPVIANDPKAKITYEESEDLAEGETMVFKTIKPSIWYTSPDSKVTKLFQSPTLIVHTGKVPKESTSHLSVTPGITSHIRLTLDNPSLDATVNPKISGAADVLVNGIKRGDTVYLQAGEFTGSIDLMYNGRKIGHIKEKTILDGESGISDKLIAQILGKPGRKPVAVKTKVHEVNEYLGGSNVYDDKIGIDNRDTAINAVYDESDVKQIVYFLPGRGQGKELQDAVEDKEVGVKIGKFDDPDVSTSGRQYMIIKDHRTEKNVWVSLDGDFVKEDEANFIYQSAIVIDIFNGKIVKNGTEEQNIEAAGMTRKSYDASLKALEVLGIQLSKEGEQVTKEELMGNKRQFEDLFQLLTGYRKGKNMGKDYFSEEYLKKTKGVDAHVYLKSFNGRLQFYTLDSDGTAEGELIRSNSLKASRTQMVQALSRMKKSATTQGRQLEQDRRDDSSYDRKGWPSTLKVVHVKDAKGDIVDRTLVAEDLVSYKEFLLGRLKTSKRAPIKTKDHKGNEVLIVSNFESISLETGAIVNIEEVTVDQDELSEETPAPTEVTRTQSSAPVSQKSSSPLGNLIEAWLATPEGSLENQTVDESASRFTLEYQKRNSLTEGKAVEDIEGSDIFNVVNQGLTAFMTVKEEINKQTSNGLITSPSPRLISRPASQEVATELSEEEKNLLLGGRGGMMDLDAYPGRSQKMNIWSKSGENAGLSNFAERTFVNEDLWGYAYNTVEGAFQAAKLNFTDAYTDKQKQALAKKLAGMTGPKARVAGRKIDGLKVAKWDKESALIMKSLIRDSFKDNPVALKELLATGNATLTHTQDKGKWGKEFPKILMEIREELRSSQLASEVKPTVVEGVSQSKKEGIEKEIKTLPIEIFNAIEIVDEVPEDILGNKDIFFAMRHLLEEKGITDEILINWAGINLRTKIREIGSTEELEAIIQKSFDTLAKEENHQELKTNPLALESFNAWKAALKPFPIAFQEIMLKHAIKHLVNPKRRKKFVLQLSPLSLTNVHGMLVNKPHEANRLGKLYNEEVLKTVGDAVDHEPSASGNGYWVHVPKATLPRTYLGYDSYEDFERWRDDLIINKEASIIRLTDRLDEGYLAKERAEYERLLEELPHGFTTANEPGLSHEDAVEAGFQDYAHVRVQHTGGIREGHHKDLLPKDYEGFYIYGYNVTDDTDTSRTKVTPISREDAEGYYKKVIEEYPLEAYGVQDRQRLHQLEFTLRTKGPESARRSIDEHERQIAQYKTAKPMDWGEEDGGTSHATSVELLRKLSPSTWCTVSDGAARNAVDAYDNYILVVNGITVAGVESHGKVKKNGDEVRGEVGKIPVADVTSVANDGTAPVEHLDDILAFFEKHNLDPDNGSIRRAKKRKAVLDRRTADDYVGMGMEQEDYDAWYAGPFDIDMDEVRQAEEEQQRDEDERAMQNWMRENVGEYGLGRGDEADALQEERNRQYFLANPLDADIDPDEAEDEAARWERLRGRGLRDRDVDLPFSKTKDNLIQGYYDPKKDKTVVVAANTPVKEAAKVAIHEVSHRGMLRMAKELGGMEELNKVLLAAEKQLMKKLPELLKRTGHESLESLMLDYGFDVESEEGKFKLLMELAARWSETLVDKPQPSWWKKFIRDIRKWIAKFAGKNLTEKQVNELVGGFVQYGTRQEVKIDDSALQKPKASTESNMARAGKLYGVEGFNARQVATVVNVFSGLTAELLLTQSMTTSRDRALQASELDRKVRTLFEKRLEFLKTQELTPELEKNIAYFEKVLDPARFRKFMLLTFLNVLRIGQGTTKASASTIGGVLAEILGDPVEGVEALDEAAIEDEENPMAAFDANFAFGTNPLDTMRFELKMRLLSTPHTELNAETYTPLGQLKYVDFPTLAANISETLSGVAYTWEDVEQRMLDAKSQYGYYQTILDALDPSKVDEADPHYRYKVDKINQTRQQLITYGAKDRANQIGAKVRPSKPGSYRDPMSGEDSYVFTFSSNLNELSRFVLSQASGKLITHGFYKINVKGNPEVDTAGVRSFLEALDAITSKAHTHKTKAKNISNLFQNKLGLNIPVSILQEDEMPGIEKDLDTSTEGKDASHTIFGKFRNSLRKVILEGADLEIDLLSDPELDPDKSGEELFVLAAQHDRTFIQNSSKDVSGKTRYLHSPPKLVTNTLNELKRAKGESTDWVDDGNYLVRSLQTMAGRDKMQIDYVDGINLFNSNEDARGFQGMTRSDRALSSLIFFGNSLEKYIGNKVMWSRHMLPTIGDKQTMPLLQVPSIRTKFKALNVNVATKRVEDLSIGDFVTKANFEKYYDMYLKNSVNMEIQRINKIRRLNNPNNESEEDPLTVAQMKAESFVFLPMLEMPHSKRLDSNDQAALHKQAKGVLLMQLTKDLQTILSDLKGTVVNMDDGTGTISSLEFLDPRQEDVKFISDHLNKDIDDIKTPEEANAAFLTFVAKYVMEAVAVKTNATMMFVGDPGAFWKKDAKTTMENTGKRLASMIAPGTAIPVITWKIGEDKNGEDIIKTNEIVRVLPLPDKFMKAQHMAYLKKLKLHKDEREIYSSIEALDGAEYVTAEEHLSMDLAQGKISQIEFRGLVNKARDPNAEFTQAERGWFNPKKPVTAGRVGSNLLYIKSAQFPLVAADTRGTELDKLRVFMEKNDFQRATHESALKVGNTILDLASIYKDDGTIDVSNPRLKTQVIETPRKNMRIQQENPVSKSKLKPHGSQAAKLSLSNIALKAIKGFELPGRKKPVNGSELHGIYMNARNEELRLKAKAFGKNYGLEVINEGNSVFLRASQGYKKNLAARMHEEAVSRGYEANELAHLYYDEAKGEFATPLWSSLSAKRINSLLQSIFYKEVLKPQIAGFSGAIRPEPGIAWEDASEAMKNAVVYTSRDGKLLFDGKKLNTTQERKDGSIQPDQIIMGWKYFGKLHQFTTKDKEGRTILDMDKVPAELLKVFAYRIPGQKKASTGSFEVVGFLPAEYGDTLIVPAELVGRIGQDYDIDKMYGMMYQTKFNKDTKRLEVIRAENAKTIKEKIEVQRNLQIDVYHSAMLNPDPRVQREVHSPVTDGYAKELAQIYDDLESTSLDMPMSYTYNSMKAENAKAATDSIGVFASFLVLHAQLNQIPVANHRGYFGTIRSANGVKYPQPYAIIMGHKRQEKGWSKKQRNANVIAWHDKVSALGKRDLLDESFVLKDEAYPEYNPRAGTISSQGSMLANHAVDNENNQLLSKLGIHRESWELWIAMTAMGYNEETISMIANSPIAKKYYSRMSAAKSLGAEGTWGTTILEEMIQDEYDAAGIETPKELYAYINFNKETLKKQVFREEIEDKENHAHNVHILKSLLTANKANKGWSSLQKNFKMDTRFPKDREDLFEAMEEAKAFTRFQLEGSSDAYRGKTFKVIMGEYNTMNAESWPHTKTQTVAGGVLSTAEDIFEDVLILDGEHLESTKFYRTLSYALEGTDTLKKLGGILSQSKSYLSARWAENLTGRSAVDLREEFLDSKSSNIAIVTLKAREAYPEVANNLFVKQLDARVDTSQDGFYTLQFRGDKNVLVSSTEMQAAFLDLVTSKNQAVREYAETLFLYDLVTGGTLSSRGFGKYIPAEYLQDMPDPKTGKARLDLGIRAQYKPNQLLFEQAVGSKEVRDMMGQIYRHDPSLAPRAEVMNEGYTDPSTGKKGTGSYIKMDKSSEGVNSPLEQLGYVYSFGKLFSLTTMEITYKDEDGNDQQGIIVREVFEEGVKKVGDYLSSQYSAKEGPQDTPERVRAKESKFDPGPGGEFDYDNLDLFEPDDSHYVDEGKEGEKEREEDKDNPFLEDDFYVPQDDEFDAPPGGKTVVPPTDSHIPLQGVVDSLFKNSKNFLLNHIIAYEKSLPFEKRVKASSKKHAYTGSYNNKTNEILYKNSITEEQLAHEFVHAYTVDAVENPKKYSPEVKNLIDTLERTRKQLVSKQEFLEQMGLKHSEVSMYLRGHIVYNRVLDKGMGREEMEEVYGEADIAAYDFHQKAENQEKFQGFVNVKEFMAEALSNPVFVNQLNQISYGSKTLYEQFLDVVSKILQELGVMPRGKTVAVLAVHNTMLVMEAVAKERGVPLKLTKPKAKPGEQISLDLYPGSEEDPNRFAEKDIDTLRSYKEKRIRQFNEVKARFKDNPKLVRDIDQRLAVERFELSSLNDSVLVSEVVDFANRELDEVQHLLANNTVSGTQMDVLQSAIQDTLSVIEFYENLRDLSDVSAKARKELAKLQARAVNLRSEYLNMSRSLLRAYAKKRFKGTPAEDFVNSESFLQMDNIDFLGATFLDASRKGRIEFSFLDGLIKDANAAQRQDFSSRMDEYYEKSQRFKETSYFQKYGWDGLVELDADGNPTPRIINTLSSKWGRELEARRKKAAESNNWKPYYKWRDANTATINVSQMYKIEDGVAIRTDNPAILRQLEKQFGINGAQEALVRQDTLMQDYVDARSAAFDMIEINNSLQPEAQEEAKAKWEAYNSPHAFYDYKVNSKMAPTGSRNDFLFYMPLMERGGKSTGFYDSRFEEMQLERDAAEYYNFIRSQFKDMMGMLPHHAMGHNAGLLRNGLFLPALRREMTLDFWDISGKWRRFKDNFFRAIMSSEQELESNLIDPITGEIRREIPTSMLNTFKDANEQEYNMDKVYAQFTMMATTYNAKNKIEDIVTMTDAVMNKIRMNQVDGKKDRVMIKGVGLTSQSQERRANILKVVRTVVDDFYGKKFKEPLIIGKRKSRTTEDKAKEANIQDKLQTLHKLYKEGKITDEKFKSRSDQLNKDLSKVGGYIDIAKIIRGITSFMQLKGMGWNVSAAAVNYVFGTMQVYRWAAGREDFDEEACRKAHRVMMNSTMNALLFGQAGDKNKFVKKIQNMMMKLNILKDYTEVRWDASKANDPKEGKRWRDKVKPYHLQKTSEYFVYGLGTIAHLMFVKVNGVSLWDSMDEEGVIQIEGYRPGEAEFTKLTASIDQFNKKIHGNYDPDSPIAIKKTLLGPMLMQFRSWVPEGLAQRLEESKFDHVLGREVKGTGRTFTGEDAHLAWSQLPKLIIPIMARKATVEGLSSVDEANLRKSAATLRQFLWLYLIQAVLARALDDDEDNGLLIYMMNILGRLDRDITFYHDPFAIQQMSQDAIPLFGMARDIAKILEAVQLTAMGDGTIPTGPSAGDSRIGHHVGTFIPHTGAAMKLADQVSILRE